MARHKIPRACLFLCVAACSAVAAIAQHPAQAEGPVRASALQSTQEEGSLRASALEETTMKLSSPAFAPNGIIPARHTCEGTDVSPQLAIAGIPSNAKSLALIMDDPDAPLGTWVHWVVFDIPVTGTIEEGGIPGRQGSNDFGSTRYGGPCPPSGTHRYFFKLYALDTMLGLKEGVLKAEVERAMEGHIVARAELIGLYRRGA